MRTMKRHAKSGRGFSIIELMVVIGIIGLLASIAMSEFSLFRKQAADKTALADLRNV
ncbi:MAG: prepilin-type N-terminal cleavage/methylation domain-containing protein, partial [Bdellovibrionales bacterium]|nr:prepilin-type N-terminal cleavage/methylation domain-containing protein [Bdellovibrionales bacterium]